MGSELTTEKIMSMSICHIRKSTARQLRDDGLLSAVSYVSPNGYGYIVHLRGLQLHQYEDEDDFVVCATFAQQHDCDYIRFGVYAPAYNELAVYDWGNEITI